MIELFTPKQIRCEHCEFEFVMTGFGSAAKIVCLACGKETVLPPPHVSPSKAADAADVAGAGAAKRKAEFPEIASQSATEALLCSVEQCPLLTESEAGSAIADQVKLRLRKQAQRRRNILAWTVTLQICVLLGVALFVAKPLLISEWIPDESVAVNQITDVEFESNISSNIAPNIGSDRGSETEQATELAAGELLPPARLLPPPLPAAPEVRMAGLNPPVSDPFAMIAEPEPVESSTEMSPFETAHHVFPPPVFDTLLSTTDLGNADFRDTASGGTDFRDTAFGGTNFEGTDFEGADFRDANFGGADFRNADFGNTEFGETLSHSLPAPPLSAAFTPLETADRLLESARATLVSDPENSVQQAIDAARMYEELGHPFPDSLYWIIGNAFASLSWGEPLLESSPPIETMTLSADNRYLLAQLRDNSVWLWDLQSPEEERAGFLLDQGTEEYVSFVFSPDLRWIIGGQRSGVVRIWDMSLRNPAETLITFVERVPDLQDLQISPNGHWLAAFGNAPQPGRLSIAHSSPHPVLLWNLRQMEAGVVPIATPVPSKPEPVRIIRFSPNSDRLAVGSQDAVIRIYDLAARGIEEEPFILRGHQLGITQIAFAPCGQWLATGSQDNTVRLWNLTSDRSSPESATLFGHMGWISALTIDHSGQYILSGSYDRTIRIWNITRNRIITALNTQPIILKTNLGVPESLALTQDGDKMIVQGSEGSLGIYHLPSLLEDDPEDFFRAITFRNSRLSISKNLLTTDDQLLIFSYEHLTNPSNNGIRLWALRTQPFVR